MGYDIRAIIEYKHDSTNTWQSWAQLRMNRNYEAFALLHAGQFSDTAIFDERGIPDDVDELTDEALEAVECSNITWLTRAELSQVAVNVDWNELTGVLLAMEALDVRGDHTRLVYGFY